MTGEAQNYPWEPAYQAYWGDRWTGLKAALQQSKGHVAWVNPWSDPRQREKFFAGREKCSQVPVELFSLKFETEIPRDVAGRKLFYPLDLASVFPPLALGVKPGECVLDLCAAPGGKGLVLLAFLGETGRMVLNEPSRLRRSRLKGVIQDYLPGSQLEHIQLTGQNGALLGKRFPETFDKILVDAPCSGEGHLLQHPLEAKRWTAARSKNLAQRQYALLRGVWAALKPGGRLVYSTCSVSPLENDGVVGRFVKKTGKDLRVHRDTWSLGETTEWGWQILPDRVSPWGPIYFAVLEKLPR